MQAQNCAPSFFRQCFILTFLLIFACSAYGKDASKFAAIVMDYDTGEILYSQEDTKPRHPASLTKMMTLYLLFEALEKNKLSLNQTLPVSKAATAKEPTKLGLKAGERIPVKDLILALVTHSANDAACVIAEGLAKTESAFSTLMTQRAREMGLKHTYFYNASGLDNPRQITSAKDMALLAKNLIKRFPQYYHFFKTKAFTFRGITYHNHNKLLGTYPGMDGLKTGYIRRSGFNLVASAVQKGKRLIAVVMGGNTPILRNQEMRRLLDFGFKQIRQAKNDRHY